MAMRLSFSGVIYHAYARTPL